MLRVSMRAMNTACLLLLNADDEGRGRAALTRAAAQVEEYERAFSRFRADSDLSHLNDSPAGRVEVPRELAALLSRALQYAKITGRVFNPLMLRELEALGYDRTFEEVPTRPHTPRPAPAYRPGRTPVRVDAARGVVTRRPGTRIDLGGVAKGAAADAALAELAPYPGALVDLGGDIRTQGQPDDADGWIVGIEDPVTADGPSIGYLRLQDGAVATSSVRKRQWTHDGNTVHHIIDPRTGRPSSTGVVQCTAITDTAEHADVAAKVGLILGAGSLREVDGIGRALGLRGMAWVMVDGSIRCTVGWKAHAPDF
jgi:thiamine biosynthesis lipoprotein